jgi:hypothetical protein
MADAKNVEEYSFDDKAIAEALASAKATHSEATANAQAAASDLSRGLSMNEGSVQTLAQCISVTTANHKICIKLPLVGSRCFTIPVNIPSGTVGKACFSICTKWPGIPVGVKVSITLGGVTVISQSFGLC